MKRLLALALLSFSAIATAADRGDYLVQMEPGTQGQMQLMRLVPAGSKIESLGINNWYHVTVAPAAMANFRMQALSQNKAVAAVETNQIIRPMESPSLVKARAMFQALKSKTPVTPKADEGTPGIDNLDIVFGSQSGNGADSLFDKQWGMKQNKVKDAWEKSRGTPETIVAVIDTGVDYTHEDLVDNMWHNAGEIGKDAQGNDKSTNGKDDDGNGYIDDIVGWDMVAKDNKPYDKYSSFLDIISGEGNPGHGTHCAGNVGARGENGKGITGVAPNIRIMALRFISEKGSGTTADAISAIKYAVDNGAKVLSNSWGSEGEDANDPDSKALKDAIAYSEGKGALFIAAAGNGHQGRGYDNDNDRAPAYPASYDNPSIVSVAAIDERGNLGSFSNWGRKSVDLGAPGVKVFSTVPTNRYQDTLGNFFGQEITWDGTSMATPHVAGAAALYWSAHPDKTAAEVKAALLSGVKKTGVLATKTVSGGQLDVYTLMQQ